MSSTHDERPDGCQCFYCCSVRRLAEANKLLGQGFLAFAAHLQLLDEIVIERGLIERADLDARLAKVAQEYQDMAMQMALALMPSPSGEKQ